MDAKYKLLKNRFKLNNVNLAFLENSRMINAIYDAMEDYKSIEFNNVALGGVINVKRSFCECEKPKYNYP